MDNPFGNAICVGLSGVHRGRVYFWDHENEPDADWDGSVESAGNVRLLAHSFAEFVAGVRPAEPVSPQSPAAPDERAYKHWWKFW